MPPVAATMLAFALVAPGGAALAQHTLVGIVRDPAGAPAAGARVAVRWFAHPELPAPVARALDTGGCETRTARCDERGLFRLAVPRRGPFEVTASDARREDLATTRFPVSVGGLLELRLEDTAIVGGLVRAQNARHAAAVPVTVRPHASAWSRLAAYAIPTPLPLSTTTDASGRFTLPLRRGSLRDPRWEPLEVPVAETDTLRSADPEMRRPAAACRDLRLDLYTRRSTGGLVCDAAGRLIEAAQVFELSAPDRVVRTDATGRFVLPTEQPADLVVLAPGHRLAMPLADASRPQGNLVVCLVPGSRIRARLRMPDGRALAAAPLLWVVDAKDALPVVVRDACDEQGNAAFTSAGGRAVSGYVLADGLWRRFAHETPDTDVDLGELTVRTRELRGTVVSATGDPVPHARVAVLPRNAANGEPALVTYADHGGRFSFDALPLHGLQLAIDASVHGIASLAIDEGRTEVVARLPASGVVTVRAIGIDGNAVAGAWITLVRPAGLDDQRYAPAGASDAGREGRTSVAGRGDDAGEVTFRGLPHGPWEIQASAWIGGAMWRGVARSATGDAVTVGMRRIPD